ncbi:MAG: host specificity factor TipJ family phage tail protein, partial [Lentilitoribacter sp.]
MNQITPINIAEAEYILPSDDGVCVVFRASPFVVEVDKFTVSSGVSIDEIIDQCFSDGNAPKSYILATIDGHEVYREHWKKVRVKSGRTVNIVVVPRKNAVKQVLAVVVAVVAVAIAPVLAAPLLSGLGIATGSVAAIAVTGVISAGLSLAGSLAVNALFPTASTGIEQSSSSVEDQTNPLYSIGGAQNSSNPYGAIPVIFGTHRVSPFYASKTYTEISGDDQYLRLLFCVGYGEIDLSDLKIGETDISGYEGLTYEILQNHLVNPPTLFTKPVYEEQLSIDLAGADWSERTTADDVDEISVDISFPNGVYRFQKSDGNKVNYTVTVQIQYRAVGSVDWLPMSDIIITSSSAQPYRRSVGAGVARGQYEVRVRKTAADYVGEDTVAEGTFWTALRARRNDSVINFDKPLTLVAMRVKATNELSSTINTFNVIAKPKIQSWNGFSWIANQNTENPADHFRHVLQSDANARSVDDEQIDLTSLQEWHDYCTANGFTFNYKQDERQSVYATLQMIASAGRAAVSQRDGKWGVVWDADDDLIVQHFTPRNSSDFESTRAYLQMPHGFRVSFINKDNNYLSDERTVYADGYSESNATEFEGLSFAGVTDPDLIWKHGRYHLAQLLLQREAYQLVVDFENLVCTRGDRVRVNHDVTLWGA